MISIFQKDGIGVKCHSSSHKITFCFIVDLTNLNKGESNCTHQVQAFAKRHFQEENCYFRLLN